MIKLSNISKSFGDVKALNNVSLDIEDSTVFGLIGTSRRHTFRSAEYAE